MSTPNTPTEAHLELAKNALFARDASGRLMTAQMVAQLLADSEARAVANAVAAIIEKNAPEIAKANAELACLRAELSTVQAQHLHEIDELAAQAKIMNALRADNLTAHQMACAAGLERDQLRSELAEAKVERETVAEASLRSLEAYIDKLKQFAERAEKAEAALAEWSVLNLWGGTPEIIHEFIKGQQNRIHYCQDLEAECLEQARLLGMSGEREADLLGKLERLAKDKARLDWLEAHALPQHSPNISISDLGRHYNGFPGSFRAAIDAAMKP